MNFSALAGATTLISPRKRDPQLRAHTGVQQTRRQMATRECAQGSPDITLDTQALHPGRPPGDLRSVCEVRWPRPKPKTRAQWTWENKRGETSGVDECRRCTMCASVSAAVCRA